ncbi:YefM antitoxin of the YoeB-YefM toxin-antitoxin pair and DNA binding transcriptional repressor [Vibrio crassostreae]|nr:YefM antitoxin of the YoeB-YefM toxin-antitoxin pair and DNA binding transcriptional repressor [Vibrio crassostreae]CAK2879143.1 YefM antitoxin of the YoeB-YefM toxin-antitoxin pair and DNA binding transcriptional repressor [Vibrio crassostreae]CAK2881348.1 YefM antitoxin of the YoeB-YefM toxin-antitoxin pair and DNA binding transcriptional repressor [Vibrio crassostreae]CAK2884572.1 YefM antitoxin of the YoeB-YefM toxin-antitoxin pair and DNA binding transcriptional repressor [Vibrio crassos
MNIISFTEARNSLKSVLDRVVDDSDVTVITRRDSEDAVVMSLDHFNSMQETLYLMSSPKNAERLAESIAQLETGNTTVRELNNDE